MRFYDFDVWIDPQSGDHYATRAHSESMGESQGKLIVSELEQNRVVLKGDADGDLPKSDIQRVGSSLFSNVFSGGVGNLFQRSVGQVFLDNNAGVRIRLRIDPPEVAALPWEMLYDADRDCFLSTSSETLLTRYIEVSKPIRDLETALPIRILLVIPGGSGLDVEHEKQQIVESLDGLGNAVEIYTLEGKVTSGSINRELVLMQFHIFHFIGHGGFKNDTGCLVLNSEETDKPDLVSAKEFAYFFQDYPSMKLVVLNSCSGAETSINSLAGTAQELVRMGVPAVVAMRQSVSDDAAKLFAENFYLKLCRGFERGRVDIAVAHARRRLIAELGDTDEFSNPVLFMRSPKGVIFDLGDDKAITSVGELHRLNAVERTHEYNIAQINKEGGAEAAGDLAKEAEAKSKVQARVTQFYKRVAISAAPRLALMTLCMAAFVFAASFTRVLNVFRIDDYLGGALRLWSDVPNKPFSPEVKVILATTDPKGNGTLGSPADEYKTWRTYHAQMVRTLASLEKKPRVIAFDLEFYEDGLDDPGFARDVASARSQDVQVVGTQRINNGGSVNPAFALNPTLQPAFGESVGDVEVGGSLPLLFGSGIFINQYEIASLKPGASLAEAEVPVEPSLALRALMENLVSQGVSARATYVELERVVRLTTVDGRIVNRIPVIRNGLSLEMVMDYAPQQELIAPVKKYHEIFQLVTSNTKEDQAKLERMFADKIVFIGHNGDTFTVIGDGERAGVEIHANAISNILTENYVPQISRTRNFVIILFMVALGVLMQTSLRKRLPMTLSLKLPYLRDILGDIKVPVLLLAVLVLYFLAAYLAYSRRHVSFDMSYHLAALLFGYWVIAIFRNKLHLQ